MAFYADQMFYSRALVPLAFGGTTSATGTGTAITATLPTTAAQFIRRSQVTGVNVQTVVAPAGGFTGGILDILNGTNTVASVTVGAAGATVAGTITTANSTFAAAGAITLQMRGTCTSGGVLAGGYAVWAEVQELYA